MTRDTQVIDIVETRPSKGPSPIGFLPAYLPNSSKEIDLKDDENKSPPYPVDSFSRGNFPIPCSVSFPSNKNNSLSDIGLKSFSPQVSPSAPTIINIEDGKGMINIERQAVEKALSNLENKVFGNSDEERREFSKEFQKVVLKIDNVKSKVSVEEQNDMDKRLEKIDEIRKKHLKHEGELYTDEETDKQDMSDNASEGNTKCTFDISSLLPKFPQLVVDVVICVKGAMKGLTTVSGATYFTIALSAALFTTYYLILFCTCRQTKRTRISEFLHSLVCTIIFLIVSFFLTEDEQLRAFGFLASVPYGSEVCWKCWNFLFNKKELLQ